MNLEKDLRSDLIMKKSTRKLLICVGLLLVAGWAVMASAQDTTSLLSAFLVNLRASHLIMGSGGTAPSASANCTLQTGSTDTSGRVVMANGATGCTITFGASFGANAADCVVSEFTTTNLSTLTSSKTAFTTAAMAANDTFNYICAGR